MKRYRQREIILIPFPYTDLTGIKQRPALIISNEKVNRSEDLICCLITSKPTEDGIKIEKSHLEEGALRFKSWIKPNRIFTINQKIVKQKLGAITPEFHALVVEEIVKLME